MTSKYEGIDNDFVKNVTDGLKERFLINANENEGVARYGSHMMDVISPKVRISKSDIKESTKRRSVRKVVEENLKNKFREAGMNVINLDNGFEVELPAMKEKGLTEFPNVNSLLVANKNVKDEYERSREADETDEAYANRNPFREL